jgi:ABC-type sugar transport system substrate-binding protein
MKKFFCIVLLCFVCLPLLFGGGQKADNKGGKRIHLTFVTPLLAHPVWLEAKTSFEQACKDYGIEGSWVGPTGIDVDAMIKQIDLAIASKVDGIITMAINAQAMMPALQRAADANIPVVLVTSDSVDSPRLAYLGLDNKNFGATQAKTAMEGLKGRKPVVAAMVSDLTQPSAREMLESAEATFKAAGDYTWAITVEDKSDTLVAVRRFQEIFNTYPDVNVVLNIVAEGPAAAAKVAEEKNLKGVIIIGISVLDETADYIRKDLVYATLSENFPRMGYEPVTWLYQYITEGKKPAKIVNDTGTVIVTKDNLTSFQQELSNRDLWK